MRPRSVLTSSRVMPITDVACLLLVRFSGADHAPVRSANHGLKSADRATLPELGAFVLPSLEKTAYASAGTSDDIIRLSG